MDMVNVWLSGRLDAATRGPSHMAKAAQTFEKVNRAARDVEAYNLERKPLVFSVFGLLAETARA
jgi:DNA polymerase-3 subunit delta'